MITTKDEAIIELQKAFAERDEFKRLERYARVIMLMHDAIFLTEDAALEPVFAYETVYEIVLNGLAAGFPSIHPTDRERISRQFCLHVTAGLGSTH
jgi:hypothetical protein